MPPLPDQVRHEFAALALGYYAAGRLAFRAHAGSLASAHVLHHAVEFVLKATLARHTTLADMKKFGHRLPDLFASAESRSSGLRSVEHRETAALLHEVWEARFPDRILAEGATLSFTTGARADAARADAVRAAAPPEHSAVHTLDLGQIDRLFCAALRATGLSPNALTVRLGPDALQAIRSENPESSLFD